MGICWEERGGGGGGGNGGVPPPQVVRRGLVGVTLRGFHFPCSSEEGVHGGTRGSPMLETWFPPRERAVGERRSCPNHTQPGQHVMRREVLERRQPGTERADLVGRQLAPVPVVGGDGLPQPAVAGRPSVRTGEA